MTKSKSNVDLMEQWIAFCKQASPGLRFWITKDLFDRLWARMRQDARFNLGDDEAPEHQMRFAITFRGGYEYGGVTFYPKSFYPNPPRIARAPSHRYTAPRL